MSPSNTMSHRPKAYLCTKWHLDLCSRLATIDVGLKLERGRRTFLGERAGSHANTKSPRLRPTSIPSGMLMHPAIWPQYMGRQVGAAAHLFWREMIGPHLTQCRLGRGLPSPPRKGAQQPPHFSVHVYCSRTVAHLSNC